MVDGDHYSPIDLEVEEEDDCDGDDGGGEEGVDAAPDPGGVRGVVAQGRRAVLQLPALRHHQLKRFMFIRYQSGVLVNKGSLVDQDKSGDFSVNLKL